MSEILHILYKLPTDKENKHKIFSYDFSSALDIHDFVWHFLIRTMIKDYFPIFYDSILNITKDRSGTDFLNPIIEKIYIEQKYIDYIYHTINFFPSGDMNKWKNFIQYLHLTELQPLSTYSIVIKLKRTPEIILKGK